MKQVPPSCPARALAVLALMFLSITAAFPATLASDWVGPLSGSQVWDNGNNWSTNPNWPDNATDTYETTVANDSATHLTITTPTAAAISVSRFLLEQTGEDGSTTLKLGNDFTITTPNGTLVSNFSNSGASPSQLAIDLNGHTFSALSTTAARNNIPKSRNFTIRDTSIGGNGVFHVGIIRSADSAGRVNVENKVTVIVDTVADMRGLSSNTTEGWNFASNATLQFVGEGYDGASYAGGTLGNVIVGSASNTDQTRAYIASSATVLGDVVYHSSTSGTGSLISLGNSAVLSVAGNFTDKNTTHGDYNYAFTLTSPSPTLRFNGGLAQEREVWIAAPTTVRFQVGESATVFGNVKLKHDFTTTFTMNAAGTAPTLNSGVFRLEQGSRINLDTHTVTATTAQIVSGTEIPTLAYTFGADSDALIHVTGTENNSLTLNSFDLELTYDGSGWISGDDLLLFRYDGTSFTGTPNLVNLTAPDGFSYDELTWGDIGGVNYVYLSNVIIPEPNTLALATLAALAFLMAARRSMGAARKITEE